MDIVAAAFDISPGSTLIYVTQTGAGGVGDPDNSSGSLGAFDFTKDVTSVGVSSLKTNLHGDFRAPTTINSELAPSTIHGDRLMWMPVGSTSHDLVNSVLWKIVKVIVLLERKIIM